MYIILDFPFLSTHGHYPKRNDQPDHEGNSCQQERNRASDDSDHIEPIGVGLTIWFHRCFTKQRSVPRVTPKPDRKEISSNRDCADRSIDEQIETHAGQHYSGKL